MATERRSLSLEGTAVHRGIHAKVTLTVEDGPIRFEQRGAIVALEELNPVATDRGVTVTDADGRVRLELVEHLLAAFGGLGVGAGVRITIDEDEMPLLDGGAARFSEALRAIGAAPTPSTLIVERAATIEVRGSTYEFAPARAITLAVDVDFRSPVGAQHASWDGDAGDFATRIAPARTFAWRDEVEALRACGRALGDVGDAAIVFDEGSTTLASGGSLRGEDEPARHKLLDLIGDLALHGGPPRGRIRAARPGHGATHAAVARALETGVLRRVLAVGIGLAALLSASRARAEVTGSADAPAPPTLQALVHQAFVASLELTLASVQPSGDADAGRGRAGVWFLHSELEYPLVPRKWYLGLAEDVAGGAVPGVGSSLFPSSPELWLRGIWSSSQGLSSGGGIGLVVPAPHDIEGNQQKELTTIRVARPWDDSLYADKTLTLRPWFDIRHVAGRVILQVRQGLDMAFDLGEPSKLTKGADFTAIGCFYAGVRATPWLGTGLELWESYAITANIVDDKRAAFALSPGVRLILPGFEPAFSVLFPISTPLRGQASSYFAARMNLAFNLDRAKLPFVTNR
jgi:UDP-3-O-acyl-N-acetylglucosamine deacetylase